MLLKELLQSMTGKTMKISVASDHAGFPLKKEILNVLPTEKYQLLDLGTNGPEPVDYPDFAMAVGKAIRSGQSDRGILICGSGVGASIAANRMPGVRAGLCHDTYSAHQGVEHDDMNVLVLGARVIGPELAMELVNAFLTAKFTGEKRHVRRLEKLKEIEEKYCKESVSE
jgi:RpiB/LacA/LacB family sugar-phosphate isomerase